MNEKTDVFFKPSVSKKNEYINGIVQALQNNGVTIVNPEDRNIYSGLSDLKVELQYLFSCKTPIYHFNWIENITALKGWKKHIRTGLTILFARLMKFVGARIVWTMHNTVPHGCESIKAGEDFYRKWLHVVDLVVVHNEDSKHLLVNKYGFPDSRILCVPHGAYKLVRKNNKKREITREKLNIGENATVFLFFGVVSKYKNIELLMKVFHSISESDAALVVCGKYDDSMTNEDKDNITKLVESDQRIRFINRFIENEEIEYFFSCSDICVLPYDKTSMQNSGAAILAFSNECPVIIPYFGYMKELSGKEFVLGYDYTCEEEHFEQLRSQMCFVIENRNEVEKRGYTAFQFAKKELSWDAIAKRLILEYMKLKGD